MSILENINNPSDLKGLDSEQLSQLSGEIREYLVECVSAAGGHLASNLGIVELTIALHSVYDTSKDRLVFDVGHQCYVHKIFTDRREALKNLRKLGGISGYPKPCESEHDAFIAGHASNSISVALGMARARTLLGEDYDVVALIGDGALTGGLSYEALSDAGASGEPLVIVLNDNGMSIRKNVGGIASYLSHQRIKPAYYSFKLWYRKAMSKIPGGKRIYGFTHRLKTMIKEAIFHCTVFEEMGLEYLGPVDGHDIEKLKNYLKWAKHLRAPAVVHVTTLKGKGYAYSEEAPYEYHGVGKFDPETGVEKSNGGFSIKFGKIMCDLAEGDGRICAITAAMQDGTGLSEFARRFPSRFFDVGIAEGHAAAMAAGMAKQGLVPVFAVYSSFLQRSYDMLIHDVAIQKLHVVLAVDRAGLVGEDGETHHGVFDVNFLSSIPGMTIFCPSSYMELETMLRHAVLEEKGPVAVRYPRGKEGNYKEDAGLGNVILRDGKDISMVVYGAMVNSALRAAEILDKQGISAEIVKLGRIFPLDIEAVKNSVGKTNCLLVAEECVAEGSVGQRIASVLAELKCVPDKMRLRNLGERFITQGTMSELYRYCGIDGESLAEEALSLLRGNGRE